MAVRSGFQRSSACSAALASAPDRVRARSTSTSADSWLEAWSEENSRRAAAIIAGIPIVSVRAADRPSARRGVTRRSRTRRSGTSAAPRPRAASRSPRSSRPGSSVGACRSATRRGTPAESGSARGGLSGARSRSWSRAGVLLAPLAVRDRCPFRSHSPGGAGRYVTWPFFGQDARADGGSTSRVRSREEVVAGRLPLGPRPGQDVLAGRFQMKCARVPRRVEHEAALRSRRRSPSPSSS